MRRVLGILAACAVVIVMAWVLADVPGQVSAEFGTLSFEAPAPVVLLGLLALFTALYVLLRVLGALLRLPSTSRRWRAERHRHTGEMAINRTLLALAAGDTAAARRGAQQARQALGDTPQTLLLAAEAGRLAGRDDEAEAAFRALAERKDAAFLGLRGLLAQAIAQENWVEAAALARRAEAAHPGAAWLRRERARLAVRAEHWTEALGLVEDNATKAALMVAAANAETDPATATRLARQAWKLDPTLPAAAIGYAQRLRASNRDRSAQSVITEAWQQAPHPDLARFLLEGIADPLARTQAAQRLTARDPDHPEGHLVLARTALDAGLTGEARRHLEAARAAGLNERRVWLMAAEVERVEHGDTDQGRQAYQAALRRAADADPDPSWRCAACNTPQSVWQPACASCHTAGRLHWASSPVSLSLPSASHTLPTARSG